MKRRNVRMFGALMGHLGRAKRDAKRDEKALESRQKVEQQVRARQEEKAAELRKQRLELGRRGTAEGDQRRALLALAREEEKIELTNRSDEASCAQRVARRCSKTRL